MFHSYSWISKTIILLTAILLLYGYLCRLFSIYFFWESKTIGWVLFWLAAVSVFRDRFNDKKQRGSRIPAEKIVIGFCIFVILLKGVLFFVTRQTTAYKAAIHFIKTSEEIKNSTGMIKSIFLAPFGSISMTNTPGGTAGQADLNFIVKGTKRFTDLNLLMSREFEKDWQVEIGR